VNPAFSRLMRSVTPGCQVLFISLYHFESWGETKLSACLLIFIVYGISFHSRTAFLNMITRSSVVMQNNVEIITQRSIIYCTTCNGLAKNYNQFNQEKPDRRIVMKKIFFGLLLWFLAANAFGADSEIGKASDLIQKDLFRNAEEITAISGTLTDMERFALYTQYEKNARLPFVVNLVVGFGLGSFIQGDIAGAAIALTGDLLGVGLPLLGYACLMQNYYGYWSFTGGNEVIYAGYVLIGITRIFESIRPFTFTQRYNETLRKSLRYNESPGLSLIPSLYNNGITLTLRYPL
jgi:hypothetical protein